MKFWEKKIPTYAGLVLIVIGVLLTSALTRSGVLLFIGASPTDTPQEVRITNIDDKSLTITYRTETSVTGSVSIGQTENSTETVLDERDQTSGIPKQYHLHSISVKNLKPQTSYIFSITSGATTYKNGNNFFQVTTAKTINTPPSNQSPISGKVREDTGDAPQEALIFINLPKGQILSTLAKADGVYILPLNTYRTVDLSSPYPFTNKSLVEILATDSVNTSHVTVALENTNPVSPITLGHDYDFTISSEPLATNSATLSPFPVFSVDKSMQATPVILTPQNNESFSDSQPQFSGKALPHEKVTIEIHSDAVISTNVTTDALGNWIYRPSTPLSPGQHTITITAPDGSGILRTVEQSFTVYASGSQVDQSATPSATVTTKPTPTPTTSVALSPSLTPRPSVGIVPTTFSKQITPRPSLPPTGSNTALTIGLTGIMTTTVGIILFLFSRGVPL